MVQGFKRRLFIQIGVTAGLIILFSIFIVLLNSDINKSGLSIDAAKEKLNLRSQTIELLSSSNNDLKKAEPLLANLKTILPTQDELINFPAEITAIAKGYGVDIGFEWKKGGTAGTPDGAGTVLFAMTLSGGYGDLSDFLAALERHRYFIRMEGVEILRTDRTPNIFTIKTNGTIYTN